MTEKELVGLAVANRVQDGEVIGVGSGTTVELAVRKLGDRISREKLNVFAIPTSQRTALFCEEVGIKVLAPVSRTRVSWAFDGADEVDSTGNLIKGHGGAMLPEKIIAQRADKFVVIVTEDKLVEKLGKKFPIPVEVIPEAVGLVEQGLSGLGAKKIAVRSAEKKYGPVITEHNNLIIDAWFDDIGRDLDQKIKLITGVVEHGLFVGITSEVLFAAAGKVWSREFSQTGFKDRLL